MGIQAISLIVEKEPTLRFKLATFAAVSCAIVAVVIVLTNATLNGIAYSYNTLDILTAVQSMSLLTAFAGFVTIPRRPMIFREGKPVDGQFTESIFSVATYEWATPYLTCARKNKELELNDLPLLAEHTRAEFLQKHFDTWSKYGSLLRTLFAKFKGVLIVQLLLISVVSCLQSLPQIGTHCIDSPLPSLWSDAGLTGIS